MARPEIIRTELGSRLREVRRLYGDPDREEFAELVGTKLSSLAQYERGDTLPNAAVLEKYGAALKINLNWLLTGNGNMYDDGSQEPSSEDSPMSENNANWDREVFKKALEMANEFESKQQGKMLPKDKLELIDMFYKELLPNDQEPK